MERFTTSNTSNPSGAGRPLVIIDNGHGCNTPGKCSPDRSVMEWAWTRKAARMLADELAARGIDSRLLVTEDTDISLSRRIARANAIAGAGALVSLHINAAGNGAEWHTARGFSAWVAPSASVSSRRLASLLNAEMRAAGFGGNRATPRDGYNTANFAILRATRMPAVLTENLFMDNRADCDLLRSPAVVASIVRAHASALQTFFTKKL